MRNLYGYMVIILSLRLQLRADEPIDFAIFCDNIDFQQKTKLPRLGINIEL